MTFRVTVICDACGKQAETSPFYCDKNCQAAHWPTHKAICKPKEEKEGSIRNVNTVHVWDDVLRYLIRKRTSWIVDRWFSQDECSLLLHKDAKTLVGAEKIMERTLRIADNDSVNLGNDRGASLFVTDRRFFTQSLHRYGGIFFRQGEQTYTDQILSLIKHKLATYDPIKSALIILMFESIDGSVACLAADLARSGTI